MTKLALFWQCTDSPNISMPKMFKKINGFKGKNCMITSIDTENLVEKSSIPS